jgi:UDP-2-acetamido-2,6-beta-L-arabino-hexul-4-ose reductase
VERTLSRVLVTGGAGFIGTHLRRRLARAGFDTITFDAQDPPEALSPAVARADAIVHLAGANRPEHDDDFDRINRGLTARLVDAVLDGGATPTVIFSSSTHAIAPVTEYGRSKRAAEEELRRLAGGRPCPVVVDRLPGVFGPGARPHYNSVVATFCHRLARGETIEVHDPGAEIELVHVGDVVDRWTELLEAERSGGWSLLPAIPAHRTTVGHLAERLRSFVGMRSGAFVPDGSNRLEAELHSTFVSYLDPDALALHPALHEDERGWLAELVKSDHAGQIFVSTSAPGVVRGNHFHERKVERFFVLRGEAVVRLRHVGGGAVREYRLTGARPSAVTIPPGYTHHVENVGDDELLMLFWANEVYDPERPDTIPEEVDE